MTIFTRLWESLGEPSSWVGFGVIVSGASTVAKPYSYIVIGCGLMGWAMKECRPANDGGSTKADSDGTDGA